MRLYLKNKLEIGKYDFEKDAYPLKVIDDAKMNFHTYGDYKFMITNPDYGKFLPVSREEAQKSNKRRIGLSPHGYISSLVHGRIYLKLLDKKMEFPKDKLQIINYEKMYRHRVVGAEFSAMDIYDYSHCDYNLIGRLQ